MNIHEYQEKFIRSRLPTGTYFNGLPKELRIELLKYCKPNQYTYDYGRYRYGVELTEILGSGDKIKCRIPTGIISIGLLNSIAVRGYKTKMSNSGWKLLLTLQYDGPSDMLYLTDYTSRPEKQSQWPMTYQLFEYLVKV